MKQSMPTREVLLGKLENLCTGSEERSDIASWAIALIEDDELRVTDQAVWNVLKRLGAVDLPAPERRYLYEVEDFRSWQAELIAP